MYEFIDIEGFERNLHSELKCSAATLCEYLGFDNWKMIRFNKDGLYGTVQYSSNNNEVSDKQYRLYLSRSGQTSYLDAIYNEKKAILHRFGDGAKFKYKPLCENAKVELYFPIFSVRSADNRVIGCLYLSKALDLKDNIYTLLTDTNIIKTLRDIQLIFEAIYMEHVEDSNLFNLIHLFSGIIQAREPFMKSHPYNVALLCSLMGLELKFSSERLHRLYIAAVLHDIGKVYIPEAIASKKGDYTEHERDIMKRHPIYSYNIVKDLFYRTKRLYGIGEIVLRHHENYNGTGYPDGLKGDDIPLESRIIAICDAVDAMLSGRSYKGAKPINAIIRELVSNKGRQFDPQLVDIMVNILMTKQKNQQVILQSPAILGTLEICTKENVCQAQGTLIRSNLGYRFKIDSGECLCVRCNCPVDKIIKATFHTVDNGKIHEYDAQVIYRGDGEMYIDKLTPNSSTDYFSLLWELEGNIIIKNTLPTRVTINRIGGDFLSFYIKADQLENMNTIKNANIITIRFDDGNTVIIPGIVISAVEVGLNTYCNFKYINILEGTRDEIFRQIFKKQVEFRKSLFELVDSKR
ncbi:MAG: HD-GYP domain-containing protein [Clostridiales bacterium]|nr:HD-GYP domain-containing protein [Clostridiales bacterium]